MRCSNWTAASSHGSANGRAENHSSCSFDVQKWKKLHFPALARVSGVAGRRQIDVDEVAPTGRRRFSGLSPFPVARLGDRPARASRRDATSLKVTAPTERFRAVAD